MRQSLYLRIAVLLVRADLHREDKKWHKAHRQAQFDLPFYNAHLLKDIGLYIDGTTIGSVFEAKDKAARTIRHLRRAARSRIIT